MASTYNAQFCKDENDYRIQFKTDDYKYYKMVEKACQKAVDKKLVTDTDTLNEPYDLKNSKWLPSPDGVNPIRCKECNAPAPFLWGEDDFGNEVITRYPFKYCPYCGTKMYGGVE